MALVSRLGPEKLAGARGELLRAMDEVRDLSDLDFVLQKQEAVDERNNTVLRGGGDEKEKLR